MKTYSHFFSTLHDETAPVGALGRGTHYSVFRAVFLGHEPRFHDFAIIWDEDHDVRVVWVVEQMLARGLFGPVLVIGERKGGVTVLTASPQNAAYVAQVETLTAELPSDSFTCAVEHFSFPSAMIISDSVERVQAYLAGVDALWRLGDKPCEFSKAGY